jgi:hypothetical protein
MLVSSRGLLSDIGQPFSDRARAALPSIAEPSWFAPPVDVRGDAESLTISFCVSESAMKLRAEVTGRTIVLSARLPAKDASSRAHRCVRVFALPFDAHRGNLRVLRKGAIVQVHVRRVHGDAHTRWSRTRTVEPSA